MDGSVKGAAAKAGEKVLELFKSWGFWLVLAIIVFAAYFYFSGRKKGKEKALEDLKDDLKVDVDTKYLQNKDGSEFDPKPITDRIYKDISGLTVFSAQRDIEVYNILLAMNDERIKAVSNDWLARYFPKEKETLRAAIGNESGISPGNVISPLLWGSANDFDKLRKAVVAKLTNLGIQ